MSKKITPWVIALACAILFHLLILKLSAEQKWFDTESKNSNFELLLLPKETTLSSEESILPFTSSVEGDPAKNTLHNDIVSPSDGAQELNNAYFNASMESTLFSNETSYEEIQIAKPDLLDLSKISLDSDEQTGAVEKVFSEELRNKITVSEATQQEYLKGQIKEINYPITIGADGARYANIKGVCWRIPEVGSDEPWAIVFAGCTGQSKTFHFELNIAPNLFLGSESPFYIGK